MRSGLASWLCFRILPKGILVHYVSALKIKGIGKKLPTLCNFISLPYCYYGNPASLSPSLPSKCICCHSWGSLPWAPAIACVKYFPTGGRHCYTQLKKCFLVQDPGRVTLYISCKFLGFGNRLESSFLYWKKNIALVLGRGVDPFTAVF